MIAVKISELMVVANSYSFVTGRCGADIKKKKKKNVGETIALSWDRKMSQRVEHEAYSLILFYSLLHFIHLRTRAWNSFKDLKV